MTADLAEPPAPLSNPSEPPPEPQHPHPPRYRRLKRYAALTILFFASILAVRLWWGHEAARRLAVEVEAIRARGEPILPRDFATEEFPEAEDAIGVYDRAAGSIAFTPAQWAFQLRFSEVAPFTDAERRQVKGVLDGNGPALQQARAARALTRFAVTSPASPAFGRALFNRGTPGKLATLLKWLALYDHETDDDAGAIEAVRDVPPLAVATDREVVSLPGHGTAEQIVAEGATTVFQIAHDLAVEGDTAPPARHATGGAVRPAGRAQVRALIAELLNDAPMREGMVRALWGHRMMVFDGEPAALDALPAPLRWPLRPAMDMDTIRAGGRFGQVAAAMAEADYLSARAKLPPPEPLTPADRPAPLECLSRLPSRAFSWRLDSHIPSHYRRLAERRMAAVALAARLYRADHGGRWPGSLDELVPAYLPSVPADPFAAGGQRLKYLPNTPGWDIPPALAAAESSYVPPPGTGPFIGGPVIYSVGEDGTDDGGSRQLNPKLVRRGHSFSFDRADWRDLVIPLAGNPEARQTDREEE